jgi:hypothetical protein
MPFLGPEMVKSETHVHKITNVPAFHMALGHNDFVGGKSLTRVVEGVKNLNFLIWHSHHSVPFQGPKKFLFLQDPHLPMALVVDLHASKSLRSAPFAT